MSTLPPHSEQHLEQLAYVLDPLLPTHVLEKAAVRHSSNAIFIRAYIDASPCDDLVTTATAAVDNLAESDYMGEVARKSARHAFRRGAGLVAFVLHGTHPSNSLVNDLTSFARSSIMATAHTRGIGIERFTDAGCQRFGAPYVTFVNRCKDDILQRQDDYDPLLRGIGFMVGVADGVRQLGIENIMKHEHGDNYWMFQSEGE